MNKKRKIEDHDDKTERGVKLRKFLAQKSLKPFVGKEKQRGTFFESILILI
jgi:hypothetical protein